MRAQTYVRERRGEEDREGGQDGGGGGWCDDGYRVKRSRNFQRSPFRKTGGAVVCRAKRTMHFGVTFGNGETAKMEISREGCKREDEADVLEVSVEEWKMMTKVVGKRFAPARRECIRRVCV